MKLIKVKKEKEEKVSDTEILEMSQEKKDFIKLMEIYKEQNPIKYAQKEEAFISKLNKMQ